jgi:nucleotide-binding universal stress UspA family protein
MMSIVQPSILVPVDTSTMSEQALPVAARLSKALELPIQLFAVVDNIVANAVTEFADTEGIDIYQSVDAYFERLLGSLAERGVAAAFHYEAGIHPADAILTFIEDNDVEMVVIASHGYSGLTRWLLGSITEKIVRSSSVPVMVVPVRET